MALIDQSYFIGYLTIGDISNGNSPIVGNTVNLSYIPNKEDEYLRAVLGYPLYAAFIEALEEDEPDEKWTDLRDGKVYEVGGESYEWRGFINSSKISPIANYVYCEYLTDNAVQVSGSGTAVNNQQNATPVSPADKIHKAWVEMKLMNQSLWHFLKNNTDTYTEFDTCRVDWSALLGSRNAFGI